MKMYRWLSAMLICLAQAGGKDAKKMKVALENVEQIINNMLK